jgi:hypothetical protein
MFFKKKKNEKNIAKKEGIIEKVVKMGIFFYNGKRQR